MQDVVRLPSVRHRQEAYLAFSLYAIKRIGVALNQVTIETAYADFREKQGLPGNDSHKYWFSEPSMARSVVETCRRRRRGALARVEEH